MDLAFALSAIEIEAKGSCKVPMRFRFEDRKRLVASWSRGLYSGIEMDFLLNGEILVVVDGVNDLVNFKYLEELWKNKSKDMCLGERGERIGFLVFWLMDRLS